MKCPYCQSEDNLCTNSRQRDRGRVRHRRCNNCGQTFRTVERYTVATLEAVENYRKENEHERI